MAAGLAACAANRQGRYEDMARRIWADAYGGSQAPANLDVEHMIDIARDLDLDMERFRSDLAGGTCREWVIEGSDELARHGIDATPTFAIGTTRLVGDRPIEELRGAIDRELGRAP